MRESNLLKALHRLANAPPDVRELRAAKCGRPHPRDHGEIGDADNQRGTGILRRRLRRRGGGAETTAMPRRRRAPRASAIDKEE